jgi:hypothetical protein
MRYAMPARTMFYPANAKSFLEVVLNILEKLRELAREFKAVGGLNARRSNGRRPGTKPASTRSEGVHASIAPNNIACSVVMITP